MAKSLLPEDGRRGIPTPKDLPVTPGAVANMLARVAQYASGVLETPTPDRIQHFNELMFLVGKARIMDGIDRVAGREEPSQDFDDMTEFVRITLRYLERLR